MPIPDEPEALRLVSEELYEIFIIVRDDLLKIDALLEYQDRYEEKWDRLFTNI